MILHMPWPIFLGLAAFGAYAIYLVLRAERQPDPPPVPHRDPSPEDTRDWPATAKPEEITRREEDGGAPDPDDCPALGDFPA
jgi:hypothetical protein